MSETTVLIGPVRLSYLWVYKPKLNKMNGKMERSVRLLIPKKPTDKCPNPNGIAKLCADAIKVAKEDKIPKAEVWDNPFRDGDKEVDSNGQPTEPGYWFLNAKADEEREVDLVDAKRLPVTREMGWQSGDWGKAVVNFYGYDQAKKGVGCGLRGIQFLYKDEALGGGGSVAHMFSDEQGDDPTAAPASAPVASSDEEYDPFKDE